MLLRTPRRFLAANVVHNLMMAINKHFLDTKNDTMKLITYVCFVLIISSCNGVPAQKTPNEKLEKDSIKVLLHTETKVSDTLTEIREVFLDYKIHSEYKKEFYKADSLFLKPFYGSYISRPKKSEDSSLIVNPYKNLINKYITISKLKGSYIFFAQGQESFAFTLNYIGDTTFISIDMMGWFVNYYRKLEFVNDKYIIDYRGEFKDSIRLEIKIIDKVNDIQIWKTSVNDNGTNRVYYELKAPLSYALKLPILVINNSLGLDTEYDGIDNIDLEKLFNE